MVGTDGGEADGGEADGGDAEAERDDDGDAGDDDGNAGDADGEGATAADGVGWAAVAEPEPPSCWTANQAIGTVTTARAMILIRSFTRPRWHADGPAPRCDTCRRGPQPVYGPLERG